MLRNVVRSHYFRGKQILTCQTSQRTLQVILVSLSGLILTIALHSTVGARGKISLDDWQTKYDVRNAIALTKWSQQSQQEKEAGLSRKLENTNKVKIILVWNNWNVKLGFQPLIDGQCPVTSCIFTADRSFYRHSDALIFYIDNQTPTDIKALPEQRQEHQRFIFAATDRLSRPGDVLTATTINSSRIRRNFFNWTMTYRRDSDIVLRDNFGSFGPQKTARSPDDRKSPPTSSFRQMKRPSFKSRLVSKIGDKSKLIVWFPSVCFTGVRREEYIRQLGQHVPIDIYGKCGNITCGIECVGKTEFDIFRLRYKFYMAFEEFWCPDYISSDFYKALDFDLVPIVLGGADYDSLAPPNSFVNALDFQTVQELADYLMLLDRNPELYTKYFEWKKLHQIHLSPMDGWCDLCRRLHDDTLPKKVYGDIQRWWIDDAKCFNSSIGAI